MAAPSTAWREQIAADEDARFSGYAEQFAAMQRAKSARYGTGRALHRKQQLGLKATLDVLAGLPAALRSVIDAARQKGMPIKVIAVGAAQAVQGADKTLPDADGHLRQRYGVPANGAAYLLRPDQHICARWLTLDATRLQAALSTALPQ